MVLLKGMKNPVDIRGDLKSQRSRLYFRDDVNKGCHLDHSLDSEHVFVDQERTINNSFTQDFI